MKNTATDMFKVAVGVIVTELTRYVIKQLIEDYERRNHKKTAANHGTYV